MNSLLLTLAAGSVLSLSSPDKSHQIEIFQDLSPDSVYSLSYDVSFKGKPMVAKGRLGLNLDNISWEKALALGKRKLRQPKVWMDLLEVDSVTYSSRDTVWHPLYGERSTVKDHWNGATLHLSRKDASKYRLDVEVRAYDEGIAFRYFFPEHPQAVFHKITEDLTSYRLPDGTMVWATDWAQAPYRRVPVDSVTTASERALTIEFPEGHWGALT
ncbi:MAG: glycoside hydrolase family 97 N-terminal domain-containing protein, partial [Muribaculaceae bacterium]|nr:glycoside hydrolase family 97 N-terminal domain-containing protein [Muribaculaceae bacterium]